MSDFIRTEPKPHDEAEELLPWYAAGQLDEAERIRVEEHLSSCSGCRQQLAFERRMIHEFRAQAPEADAGWERLRKRIETERVRPRAWQHRSSTSFGALVRRPAIAMLAAAQLAFVVLAAALLLSLSRPTYHALGSPPPAPNANIIVIFRGDATVEDIRDVLRASGASIVGGPTPADAYLLRVPARQRELALAKLKSNDQVQMAEPVDGAAQ